MSESNPDSDLDPDFGPDAWRSLCNGRARVTVYIG